MLTVGSNMKKYILYLIFCFSFFDLKGQEFERMEPFDIDPLEIECSITRGGQDYYELNWNVPRIDSIAKAKGQLPTSELHCFVYDSSGIIGYYKGLSTPMSHCSFKTKDPTVEVFFRLRKIPYLTHTQDSVEIRIQVLDLLPFSKTSHRGPEFESIRLPIDSTSNSRLTLFNDTNTVKLSYGTQPNYDRLGMPILGFTNSSVISLNRYYVNLKTGRIATGQKWINRKGIKKLVKDAGQFVWISKSAKYVDQNNKSFSGEELIQARKVNLKRFDLNKFYKVDQENYPH